MYDKSAECCAALTSSIDSAEGDRSLGEGKIRTGCHNHRVIAAELQDAATKPATDLCGDLASDRNRSGERDLTDDRVRDQVISALSGATPEQLQSLEGRNVVKEDIKLRLNEFLYDGQVQEVYFSAFYFQANTGYSDGQ